MDNLNKSLGKVSIGVPSVFTFVPAVRKLPFERVITGEDRSGALTGNPNKNVAASHEETTGEIMSDRELFRAEKVFINDAVEGGAGNVTQPGTKHPLKPSPDHVSLSQTKASPQLSAQSENTSNHTAAGTAAMETAVDKHRGISQRQRHGTSGLTEVSSGCFANRSSEDRTSPTRSADLFPTPASSRESILSEGSDKDRSWSAVQLSSLASPASLSRTVSPCSSVLSGIFSPAVVQIKKHFLAPGSSLVHTPQTCLSSCESLSSVCPQSPLPRHRPPLTRLSLLTAILRKGRLPVLSSALQRPYTPCWPVNPVTLSFCNACSAASSVASIPLEFSSQFSSSASIDSQSHVHRESNRHVTSPPPVLSSELSSALKYPQIQVKRCPEQIRSRSAPRWEQTHKIKLSYKSLAAIPTNTLLLDQQAIDEQVERNESPCGTSERGVTDTHAEMCSPAQLRQQSEELYAVIDELLANSSSSIPACKASRSLQSSRSSTPSAGLQNNSSFPKSLGRETKYASLCSLHPSTGVERNLLDPKNLSVQTKPGVIRPLTAIPRLTVEDEDKFYPNPFRQFAVKPTSSYNKKVGGKSLEEAGKDFRTGSGGQALRAERKPERRSPFSVCDLQITEPDDRISHSVKDTATPFSPTEGWMSALQTHI